MLLKKLMLTVSLGALVIVLGAPAWAQKDAAAAQALRKAAQAAGFALGDLTSLAATGTYLELGSLQQIPQTLSVKVLGPDRVRWELSGPDGAVVTAVDGDSGWTRSGNTVRGLSVAEAAARGIAFFPLLALDEWIASPRSRLESPRPEVAKEGGLALTRVPITSVSPVAGDGPALEARETISRFDLLTESGSGRVAAVELTDRSSGDWRLGVPLRIVFGDPARVGGVVLPRTLTGLRDGKPVWRIHFDSILVNPPLSEDDFLP